MSREQNGACLTMVFNQNVFEHDNTLMLNLGGNFELFYAFDNSQPLIASSLRIISCLSFQKRTTSIS